MGRRKSGAWWKVGIVLLCVTVGAVWYFKPTELSSKAPMTESKVKNVTAQALRVAELELMRIEMGDSPPLWCVWCSSPRSLERKVKKARDELKKRIVTMGGGSREKQ